MASDVAHCRSGNVHQKSPTKIAGQAGNRTRAMSRAHSAAGHTGDALRAKTPQQSELAGNEVTTVKIPITGNLEKVRSHRLTASANYLISSSASRDCCNAHELQPAPRRNSETATEFARWPRIIRSSRHGAARKEPMVRPLPLLERHQQIDPRQRETKRALHRPKQCDPAHDAISVMITPFPLGKAYI